MIKRCLLCSLLLAMVASVSAQAGDGLPVLAVPRIAPVRDARGCLTDATWEKAARLTLADCWAQAPRFSATEVLLLNTGPTLAVAFVARDDDIRATQTARKSKTYLDDCVELFLGRPEENLTESIGLECNTLGALSDFRYRQPEVLDFDWRVRDERIWVSRRAELAPPGRATAGGPGYIIVIELSWAAVRDGVALPGAGAPERLRANFGRWDRGGAGDVFTIWSDSKMPIPKPHNTARYGWLIFEK